MLNINKMKTVVKSKRLYEEPCAEVLYIKGGLPLLNSLSLGADFSDWQEGDDEDWGTWERP